MLLFVVAVFNLNVVPSIAANGGVTVWLWIISVLLFFWPQGIAVIELSQRYPGEGGLRVVAAVGGPVELGAGRCLNETGQSEAGQD